VADAHGTGEPSHVLLPEDVADQAVGLAEQDLALIAGHNPRRVLAAVLQDRQRIVEALINVVTGDHSDDTAHK